MLIRLHRNVSHLVMVVPDTRISFFRPHHYVVVSAVHQQLDYGAWCCLLDVEGCTA